MLKLYIPTGGASRDQGMLFEKEGYAYTLGCRQIYMHTGFTSSQWE